MTTFYVTNASQLSTAITSATGGDVIRLAGGEYGDFVISSKNFSSEITLMSVDSTDPAVFNSLNVKVSSNINFQGIHVDLEPTRATTSSTSALNIDRSDGITFQNGVIHGGPAVSGVPVTATDDDATGNVIGLPTGRGVSIQGSSDILIADNNISQFLRGIVVGTSDGVKLLDNEIHHLRKSAIVGNSDNLLIEGNYLHSSNPWRIGEPNGDHADFIALWTDSRQTAPTSNITIRDNVMSQGDGARILGLWLQGGEDGYRNVIIEGNAILGGDHQGIMMSNTVGGVVANNVLLQTTAYEKAPAILLLEGAAQFTVSGNIAWSIADKNAGATGNVIGENTYVQKASALAGGYYDSTLIGKVLSIVDADAIYALADTTILGTSGGLTGKTPTTSPSTSPVADSTGLITGTSGADIMVGTSGDDTFDGRGGVDVMTGGKGHDTYVVPNTQAKIVELAAQGTDTVVARGNYTLGSNLENLVVSDTSTNGWSGTGNALNNILTGNAGGNALDGQAGADTIFGGAGNDVLVGGAGADRLIGGAGADTFRFARGSGQDVVVDFGTGGRDVLDIGAYINASVKHTISDTGEATVIRFSSGDTITLIGVDSQDLISIDKGYTI